MNYILGNFNNKGIGRQLWFHCDCPPKKNTWWPQLPHTAGGLDDGFQTQKHMGLRQNSGMDRPAVIQTAFWYGSGVWIVLWVQGMDRGFIFWLTAISWHSHHSHGQRSESNGIHGSYGSYGSYWIISTSAITGHHRPSPWLRLIAPTGPTLHVHIDPNRAVAAAAHGGPLSFSFTPAALAVGNGIAMEVRTLRVETRHDILRWFQAA